ncbi:amidophosphoribosyltransferase [Candidatus Woesearchaeota archaeon]|nr:amidophosphoribosyltransferase [Candidatus Woesearchaeota archaeon]
MTGLFGIVSKDDCSRTLFFGTDYHSHLGTQYGGMSTMNDDGFIDNAIHNITTGQFKSKFHNEYKGMEGRMGIGAISDRDAQPLRLFGQFGAFALVTCGRAGNMDALAKMIVKEGGTFSAMMDGNEINMTELVANILNRGGDPLKGIENVFDKIDGSCSLLMMTKDGIYAARDSMGRTTLALGRNIDGECAVASETCAFPNLGFKTYRFLKPGEVVLMNESGVRTMRKGSDEKMQICSFYWIYTGYPASYYDGINAEAVRYNCGAIMAEMDADLKVDVVMGMPDSGIAHGIGYAKKRQEMGWQKLPGFFNEQLTKFVERNMSALQGAGENVSEVLARLLAEQNPALDDALKGLASPAFERGILKYTDGYSRSYTPPDQRKRDEVAHYKQIAIGAILSNGWNELERNHAEGRVIVISEDSIVRNTQLRKSIQKLWDWGAKEIHVRPGCPPLTSPCEYLNATKKHDELVARRAIMDMEGMDVEDISAYVDHTTPDYEEMIRWIEKDLNVNSVKYPTIDQMAAAIGLPREKLCVDCWL